MPSVLFICTANQFRSPIAETCLKQKLSNLGQLDEWRVSSAGTWTKKGLPAHPLAVKAATGVGLDLSEHRSKPVTPRLLERSDLVVVMEKDHKEALLTEFPQMKDKIILLTELVGETNSNVPDPVVDKCHDADEVTEMICHLIDNGFDNLLSLANNGHTA